MGRVVKLVSVTDANNNKFYLMEEVENELHVTWGRVGAGGCKTVYSISDWDKKYKEKIRKGDEDVTELISVAKAEANTDIDITNTTIKELVKFLQDAAKATVKANYTIAVADVTQKQLEAAQNLVDELVSLAKEPIDVQLVNSKLLQLYKTIPRKMSDTKNYLLQAPNLDFLKKLIENEQSLLDTLSGQVSSSAISSRTDKLSLDSYGIQIEVASDEDRNRIAEETDFRVSNQKIFKVTNNKTQARFDSTKTKLFFHGSRNENWWNILQTGLQIKPANVVITGKMFGQGTYFASRCAKSIGYTSLRGTRWANGNSSKAYLAIFEVNLGKVWPVMGSSGRWESWMGSLTYDKVKSKGYDSVYAKGGADLINDEYVIYEEFRCTIKYLIELKG